MNNELYALVQKFREYRLDLGITLQNIEEETGISQQRLKRVEQGISPITVEEVDRLLAFYDTDINSILSYNDLQGVSGWKRRGVAAAMWLVLLGVLGYGGYEGLGLLKSATPSTALNTSVAKIITDGQTSVKPEQKAIEMLEQQAQPASSNKKEAEGKQAAILSPAAEEFRLAVYTDTQYDTKKVEPVPDADFQLFPVARFHAEKAVPAWLLEAKHRSPSAIALANRDILEGQSRESIEKQIADVRKSNVGVLGYGKQSQVFTPHIFESNGTKYGMLSYTRVVPDVTWKAEGNHVGVADAYGKHIFDDIKKAKEKADVLVVTMFWGSEKQSQPEAYQKDMAHRLIDAGADVVVGHRSPVSQPYEVYKGKYIVYNLGSYNLSLTFDKKQVKEAALIHKKEQRIIK